MITGIGNAISAQVKLTNDANTYRLAIDKYKESLSIFPNFNALDNWGASLMNLSNLEGNSQLLDEAKCKIMEAKLINDKPSYNLACLYALHRDFSNCKKELYNCLKAGTLPEKNFIENDIDLVSIREEDWYKELLKKI
ncbi:TPR end-of-group domain-containing protein [Photobacterium leiognathi subsp. mandapamensis]|uniref:TPR end-of-group domain-containing protein n=1 Tax=Photobacterium leiognathi TaxID=553611 RepID=UPI003AF3E0B2